MDIETKNIEEKELVIGIKDLYKSFGNNHVLRGINLDVFRQDNVVVLGRSGTGKSVLIKVISGLLKPDRGTVNVLGQEVATLNEKELQELRLHIGFSFQGSALYDSMTVRENLAFPLVRNKRNLTKQEIQSEIESVLDDVGLLQTINQMPSELSGGQRKRIGIARTLILRPQIMLYDEPTSGLDPITSEEINALINLVKDKFNTTSIIITHDLTCAKSTGDKIAMMFNGEFIKQGTFDEVFSSDDERIQNFYKYNFIN
ncbi:MAG TPA: ATP-binding cassette domain-containing protein [Hanamia sp.]|jgi:phospholipid/cholesterol/gamma-HCH transport system ATP-binding protein|nr:ATP-binding cassette domain-containing protein [Hanamia sp.]